VVNQLSLAYHASIDDNLFPDLTSKIDTSMYNAHKYFQATVINQKSTRHDTYVPWNVKEYFKVYVYDSNGSSAPQYK